MYLEVLINEEIEFNGHDSQSKRLACY